MVYNLAVMGKVYHRLKQPFFSGPWRFSVANFGTAVLFLISLVASLAYLRLGLARVFYPYALDLIEEDMVMQAWRVAQGLPVFVPPNAEFVPQVYMPLFTWLGGQLMRLTAFAFWPLRLISFLSTVGTAVLIFYVGWRACGRKTAAFAGSALFLAGYRLVGGWYDLARVDALFTFLCLAGLVALVYGGKGTQRGAEAARSYPEIGIVLSAVLLGLAVLTKQNGLFLVVVAGFYLFIAESAESDKKSVFIHVLLLFVVPFLLVVGVPILLWQLNSDGWFGYYLVIIAFASPLLASRVLNIFLWELGASMGVLVTIISLLILRQLGSFFKVSKIGDWRLTISNLQSLISRNPWLLFVGTAVFMSVAGRTATGGNLNNMIIGYALLCLAPALSLSYLRKRVSIPAEKLDSRLCGNDTFGRAKFIRWAWLAATVVQFVLVTFPLHGILPQTYWPTAEMRAAGDALLARVAEEPGEVWLLLHPSYALRAGKRPYVHLQSLWHARQRGTEPLPADLVALVEQQQFAQIISDESDFFETEPAFVELLLTHYEVAETLPPSQSPPTLSGPIVRPLTVYIPRR